MAEPLGIEMMTEKEAKEMQIKMEEWKKKGMCGFCGIFNGHNDWCKEKPDA